MSKRATGIHVQGDEHCPMLVMAHGAGAGFESHFMTSMTGHLVRAGLCVARFNFSYMDTMAKTGIRRPPDSMARLMEQYQDVLSTLGRPCFIGGKSMGGRVATMILAEQSDFGCATQTRVEESCLGGVVYGYPFHSKSKPEQLRVSHFERLVKPVLIFQGERDLLGNKSTVSGLRLSKKVSVRWYEDGDHDLRPRIKSGHDYDRYLIGMSLETARFCGAVHASISR